MSLFRKNTTAVKPVDFNMNDYERVMRFGVVGSYYATSDGPSGDVLIKQITGRKDGWYEGELKPCMYKGATAVKVCLKNSNGKYVHVGWIPKEKANQVAKLRVKEKGKVIIEYVYNKEVDGNILRAFLYWE